jgi:hypothetical protein
MQGFDIETGLRHYDQDEAFYLKQLVRFREALEEQYASLPDVLRSGDTAKAAELAHSLKGTAGAVAAVHLQGLASRVYRDIESGSRIDGERVADLSHALSTARQELIDSIPESATTTELPHSEGGPSEGLETLRMLRRKLVHNEFVEDKVIDGALNYLSERIDDVRCSALRRHVERFETRPALELLHEFATEQEIPII